MKSGAERTIVVVFALGLGACGEAPDVESPLTEAVSGTTTSGGSTTGKATFTDDTGATVHMQVTGYEYPNGSFKGQQAWNSTGAPASWHGDTPTCYAVVSPGHSLFAGPITSASDPTMTGQYYVIEVVDSTTTAPDQIGVEWVKQAPNCNNLHVTTLYPITAGNLTVR
jgi:hypothetical protein